MLSGGIADCACVAEFTLCGDVVTNPAKKNTLNVENAKVEVGNTLQLNATVTRVTLAVAS